MITRRACRVCGAGRAGRRGGAAAEEAPAPLRIRTSLAATGRDGTGRGLSLPSPLLLGVGNPHLLPERSRAPRPLNFFPPPPPGSGHHYRDLKTGEKARKTQSDGVGGVGALGSAGCGEPGAFSLPPQAAAEGSAATAGRSEPGSQRLPLRRGVFRWLGKGRGFSTVSRLLSHSPWVSRCGGVGGVPGEPLPAGPKRAAPPSGPRRLPRSPAPGQHPGKSIARRLSVPR